MKIVCTSDTHFEFGLLPEGDVLIHAGDFMYSGYEREWYSRVKSFAEQPHKTKILVAGNHDLHLERYAGPALQELRAAGVQVVGAPTMTDTYTFENGMTMLALPYVNNLPNWAFNRSEQWTKDFVSHQKRHDIVVSHSPPRGLLDHAGWGVPAWREYIERYEPPIWICGHIHEAYGTMKYKKTTLYNVANCDRNYKQVNPPMVIEV